MINALSSLSRFCAAAGLDEDVLQQCNYRALFRSHMESIAFVFFCLLNIWASA